MVRSSDGRETTKSHSRSSSNVGSGPLSEVCALDASPIRTPWVLNFPARSTSRCSQGVTMLANIDVPPDMLCTSEAHAVRRWVNSIAIGPRALRNSRCFGTQLIPQILRSGTQFLSVITTRCCSLLHQLGCIGRVLHGMLRSRIAKNQL